MEKKIEDYAPFYLGCKVKSFWGSTIEIVTLKGVIGEVLIYGFDREDFEITHSYRPSGNKSKRKDKLILRPLSDMTEEEVKEVLLMILDSPIHLDKDERVTKEEINACINSIEPDDNAFVVYFSLRCADMHLYISNHSGLIRLYDEDSIEQYFEFHPELVRYLLSKSFDLFGLIDSGIAIDKTTLK